jgi:hypothetical protein
MSLSHPTTSRCASAYRQRDSASSGRTIPALHAMRPAGCGPLATAKRRSIPVAASTCRTQTRAVSNAEEWSVSAGRLRHDHRCFDTRLIEIVRRARLGGWAALATTFAVFSDDVVRHFAFEELAVFPGFARTRPGEAYLTARLIDEHETLRCAMAGLGARIEVGNVAAESIEVFATAMQAHQELENLRIDPWLEAHERRVMPSGRR